jgi:hypothetical protein
MEFIHLSLKRKLHALESEETQEVKKDNQKELFLKSKIFLKGFQYLKF